MKNKLASLTKFEKMRMQITCSTILIQQNVYLLYKNYFFYLYSSYLIRHWNGGPPRYQNPPIAPPASEYERPPPYYYPGAPSED